MHLCKGGHFHFNVFFRILELEQSSGEAKKLNEVVKKKDETMKRYEDRLVEASFSKYLLRVLKHCSLFGMSGVHLLVLQASCSTYLNIHTSLNQDSFLNFTEFDMLKCCIYRV